MEKYIILGFSIGFILSVLIGIFIIPDIYGTGIDAGIATFITTFTLNFGGIQIGIYIANRRNKK